MTETTSLETLQAEVARLSSDLAASRASEAALRAEVAMLRNVLDQLPDGVFVVSATGASLVTNRAANAMLGIEEVDPKKVDSPEAWVADHGIFKADGVTPYKVEETPLGRAMFGADVPEEELVVKSARTPEGMSITSLARPWYTADGKMGGALSFFRDITPRKRLERDIEQRTKQLQDSELEKTHLIERLRMAVEELSTPILEVWNDVIAMPVIGIVDSRRSAEMVERLLAEVVRAQARFVIVDLTGVEVVDTKTADHFISLVRSVELIGAHCMLTGIRPAVAETLVTLGVDFGSLKTLKNLKQGLRECLRLDQLERGRTTKGNAKDGARKEASKSAKG